MAIEAMWCEIFVQMEWPKLNSNRYSQILSVGEFKGETQRGMET